MGRLEDAYVRDKADVLGRGTYAVVYGGIHRPSNERVALKQLRQHLQPPLPQQQQCAQGAAGQPSRQLSVAEAAAAAIAAACGQGAQGGGAADGGIADARTARGDGVDDRGGMGLACLREIKVLQELRHPHIVRLRETVTYKESTLVLVFDYAAGGDLEALIHGRGQGPHAAGGTPARCGPGPGGFGAAEDDAAGAALSQGGLQREPQPSQLGAAAAAGGGGGGCGPGPLAAGVVKAHMKALLEALMHCHEQGVLHRDVKPNNMLLDGQGRLLLADFGLARYLPREPPTTFSASAAPGLSAATSALPTRAATAEPSAASLPLPPPGGAPQAGARVPPPDGTTVAEVCARQLALERARRAQREMDDLIDRAYYGDGDAADGAGGGTGGEQSAAAPAVQQGAPMNGHLQYVEASQGQAADHATANGGPVSVVARGSALPSPFAAHAGIAVAGAAAVAAAVCGGCRPGEGPGEEVPVMTHQIGMRWYRPPELLMGCRVYGTGVDMWAAGCVFAEMMLGRVWFKGSTDLEQMGTIWRTLGKPTEDTWPGVTQLPHYLGPSHPPQDLDALFPGAPPGAVDLLRQLVALCPERRPTARQALAHPYFAADPPPTPPGQLPLAPPRGTVAAAGRASGPADLGFAGFSGFAGFAGGAFDLAGRGGAGRGEEPAGMRRQPSGPLPGRAGAGGMRAGLQAVPSLSRMPSAGSLPRLPSFNQLESSYPAAGGGPGGAVGPGGAGVAVAGPLGLSRRPSYSRMSLDGISGSLSLQLPLQLQLQMPHVPALQEQGQGQATAEGADAGPVAAAGGGGGQARRLPSFLPTISLPHPLPDAAAAGIRAALAAATGPGPTQATSEAAAEPLAQPFSRRSCPGYLMSFSLPPPQMQQQKQPWPWPVPLPLAQLPPLQEQQELAAPAQPVALAAAAAAGPAALTAPAGARRRHRARRNRSSAAGAMSVCESAPGLGPAGGVMEGCGAEAMALDGADEADDAGGGPEELAEEGEGDEYGTAAEGEEEEAEGQEEADGLGHGPGYRPYLDDDEQEDEDDGGRRVVRRFSFGSSLAATPAATNTTNTLGGGAPAATTGPPAAHDSGGGRGGNGTVSAGAMAQSAGGGGSDGGGSSMLSAEVEGGGGGGGGGVAPMVTGATTTAFTAATAVTGSTSVDLMSISCAGGGGAAGGARRGGAAVGTASVATVGSKRSRAAMLSAAAAAAAAPGNSGGGSAQRHASHHHLHHHNHHHPPLPPPLHVALAAAAAVAGPQEHRASTSHIEAIEPGATQPGAGGDGAAWALGAPRNSSGGSGGLARSLAIGEAAGATGEAQAVARHRLSAVGAAAPQGAVPSPALRGFNAITGRGSSAGSGGGVDVEEGDVHEGAVGMAAGMTLPAGGGVTGLAPTTSVCMSMAASASACAADAHPRHRRTASDAAHPHPLPLQPAADDVDDERPGAGAAPAGAHAAPLPSPPLQQPHAAAGAGGGGGGRLSDVSVVMSLSLAGGVVGADPRATQAAPGTAALVAPPTVTGPILAAGAAAAPMSVDLPTARGPLLRAAGDMRAGNAGGVAAGAGASARQGGGAAGAADGGGLGGGAELPSFPHRPPVAPRVPAASAEMGAIAAAAAAADGGAEDLMRLGGGGGAGGGLLGPGLGLGVAALSDSPHRGAGGAGGGGGGTRYGSARGLGTPDLTYLRQRTAEMDELLRQASQQADDSQKQPPQSQPVQQQE